MWREEATGCMGGEWVALVLLCSYRVSGPLITLYDERLARQTAPQLEGECDTRHHVCM